MKNEKPFVQQTHQEKKESFKEVAFEAARALRKAEQHDEADRLLIATGYFLACSVAPKH